MKTKKRRKKKIKTLLALRDLADKVTFTVNGDLKALWEVCSNIIGPETQTNKVDVLWIMMNQLISNPQKPLQVMNDYIEQGDETDPLNLSFSLTEDRREAWAKCADLVCPDGSVSKLTLLYEIMVNFKTSYPKRVLSVNDYLENHKQQLQNFNQNS